MGHRMCRECHRLVSEEAKACPHCGVPRPGAPGDRESWASRYRGAIAVALVLLGVEIAWFRHQMAQLTGPPSTLPVPAARVDSFPGYRSLAKGVWLGARLYDRRDRSYVGRITSLHCPEPAPRDGVWRCMEVEYADGERGWVSRRDGEARYLALETAP